MPETNRRRAVWPAHLLALAGYLLLTLLWTWPLAQNLTAAIPGDSFDGWQNYWNLWWIKLALVDRLISPLFTDILYAPTGVGLYFHTLNPLNGLASLPIQLSAGLIPAYNAVVFFSWVLGGYGMFLLARQVLGACTVLANVAAFVAGMIYTFSPFHMAHLLGHMQVMSLQWLPFYILYLLRATRASVRAGTRSAAAESRQGPEALPADLVPLQLSSHRRTPAGSWVRGGLMAGLFLAANGLSDWYFVLYLLLFTTLFLIWQWITGIVTIRRGMRSGGERLAATASAQSPDLMPAQGDGTAAQKAAFSLRALWLVLWQVLWQVLWLVLRPSLLAAGVFVLLLSPWLLPMMREAREFQFMVRPPADLYQYSASLADFLVPNRLHTLLRPASFEWIGNQIAPISERTIAIGYVALGLAVAAALLAWRQARFWITAAVLFLLLALGPQWHWGNITQADIPAAVLAGGEVQSPTPYALLNRWVPFMRISRSVSRFAVLVQLSAAVLAAVGLYSVLGRSERRRSRLSLQWALAGLVIVGIGFEYWVAPYPISPPDTPDYYAQLADDPDERAVLNLPMNYDRPGYLLYQTVHGKPLTVAYISRDDPRTLTERVPVLQHFRHLRPDILGGDPVQIAPTVFADLGVGTVILDRYKMPGGEEREYTEALAGRIFAGQTPIYADERLMVYRVQPPAALEPYLELGSRNWGPLTEGTEGTEGVDGQPQRQISGPAAVTIRHAAGEQRVQVRYRTQGEGGVLVRSPADGSVLAELPPAPNGGEAVFAVLLGAGSTETDFVLEPIGGAAAYIEQLLLQPATPLPD